MHTGVRQRSRLSVYEKQYHIMIKDFILGVDIGTLGTQ